MGSSGKLATLAWVLCAHAAALLLFTTGFFLTRFEVSDVSQCTTLPHTLDAEPAHLLRHGDDGSERVAQDDSGCWMPRRYKRVVFVVIDALRYDFVANSSATDASGSASFYRNHLPVFHDVLARKPQHALLLKFVADAPTMTMQRLKGLTTGSLPTFLDIKDNMASAVIAEDNLLRQMRAQQRPVVFMGDDTWDALYAQHFARKYAFDSFNVKDLDSVDHGVTQHLFPELARRDWGLLIAHFLGVDHVGHTHGPSSPFMAAKLREMNTVMTKLIAALESEDDDADADDADNSGTLLAVMGDHGMSADGNHGGASDDETGAALFLFSKQPLTRADGDGATADASPAWPREVPQVDLVPTLALLSGLPIPFGSLGSVIPQLFFTARDRGAAFATLNRALALNVDQVRRYLLRYSRASKLPARAYETLETLFRDIAALRVRVHENAAASTTTTTTAAGTDDHEAIAAELAVRQQAFLREALALGRSIWTQFDLLSMGWGIFFLLWSLALVVAHGALAHNDSDGYFPMWSSAAGAAVGYFMPALGKLMPVLPAAASSRALMLALLCGLVDSSARVHVPPVPSARQLAQTLVASVDPITVTATAVVLLHALALLSNSYIVAEAQVLTFLSVTAGFALLLQCQRVRAVQPARRAAAVASSLVLIVCTRAASVLDPPNIIQSDVTLLRTVAPLAALVALAYGATAAFTGASPLAGVSWRVRCALASVATSCASCGAYWALSPSASTVVRLWLPRSVLFTALGALVLQLVPRSSGSSESERHASAHRPDRLRLDAERVLLVFQVAPAFMLVIGPTSPLSVLLLVLQCLSFAAVAVLCHGSEPLDATVAAPPLSWTLLWSTVCYQSFFFTGHANTFTSLQNAAGFVGVDGFHYYTAGALLALNTFGSYLLWLLCIPLLLARHQQQQGAVLSRASWWRAAFAVAGCFALKTTVSTVFVALQRRHLMVWAIFAPKFIFDAATLVVLELLLLLTAWVSGVQTCSHKSAGTRQSARATR